MPVQTLVVCEEPGVDQQISIYQMTDILSFSSVLLAVVDLKRTLPWCHGDWTVESTNLSRLQSAWALRKRMMSVATRQGQCSGKHQGRRDRYRHVEYVTEARR